MRELCRAPSIFVNYVLRKQGKQWVKNNPVAYPALLYHLNALNGLVTTLPGVFSFSYPKQLARHLQFKGHLAEHYEFICHQALKFKELGHCLLGKIKEQLYFAP